MKQLRQGIVFGSYILIAIFLYSFFQNNNSLELAALKTLPFLLIIGIGLMYTYFHVSNLLSNKYLVDTYISPLSIGIAFILGTTVIALLSIINTNNFIPSDLLVVPLVVTTNITTLLMLAVLIYGIGYGVLSGKVNALRSIRENPLYVLAIGITATIVFFFLASLLHIVTPLLLIIYLGLALIFTYMVRDSIRTFASNKSIRFTLGTDIINPTILSTVILIILMLFFAISFVSSSAVEPIDSDSMRTYYLIPSSIIEHKGIVLFPYDTLNQAPHAGSYLYIPFIMLSKSLANYMSLLFFLSVLFATNILSKKIFNKHEDLITPLLLACLPLTFWFLNTAKVDFLIVFLITTSCVAMLQAVEKKQSSLFFFSGLIIGLSIAIKYSALLLVPGFALFSLVLILKRNPYLLIKSGALCLLGVCIGFLPWALYNFAEWGNIIHPYLAAGTTTIHSSLSIETKVQMYKLYLAVTNKGQVFDASHAWFVNLWYLITGQSQFTANRLGPIIFSFLPLILIPLRIRSKRFGILLIAIFIVASLSTWILISPQQAWYILPALLFLALLIAVSISSIQNRVIVFLLALVLMTQLLLSVNTSRLVFAKTLTGRVSRESLTTEILGDTSLYDYLNIELINNDPEYLAFPMGQLRNTLIKDSAKHLYSNNVFLNEWVSITVNDTDPEVITNELRKRGVTHIYEITRDMNSFRALWCEGDVSVEDCSLYDNLVTKPYTSLIKGLTPVYSGNGWNLFKIGPNR